MKNIKINGQLCPAVIKNSSVSFPSCLPFSLSLFLSFYHFSKSSCNFIRRHLTRSQGCLHYDIENVSTNSNWLLIILVSLLPAASQDKVKINRQANLRATFRVSSQPDYE